MSKEEKIYKDKRLWAAAAIAVLILVLIIAALIIRNNKRTAQEKDIASLLSGYLTSEEANTELNFLSGLSEEDAEKIIMAMVRTLNGFSENGDLSSMNKDEMLAAIQAALTNLGLDLNEQQIRLLSERLLEHYLENASETYKSTKEINNTIQTMEDTMSNQMSENLTSISEYLTRLDETVLNNQSQLELISQTQTENLHQVYQYVSELDQDVIDVKNQLNSFEERYAADVAANNVSFSNISSKLEETKKLIDSTKSQVITVLDELEASNQNRYQDTSNKIAEVKNSVSSLDSHLTDVYNDLDKTISDFEKNMEDTMSENHQTMLSELTSAKDFLKSAMDENMSSINTLASNLSSMIEENFDETQEMIRSDVEDLQAKMDSIHTQIVTTQTEITALLNEAVLSVKTKKIEILLEDQLFKFKRVALSKNEDGSLIYRYGPLFVFGFNTGLREGELLALSRDGIRTNHNKTLSYHVSEGVSTVKDRSKNAEQKSKRIITAPKYPRSVRNVPLNKEAITCLRYMERTYGESTFRSDLIVTTQTGLLPTPRNLQNAFDSICKKAGIPHYGIHAMRHTFATNLLSHAKNQREVKAVAEIMGEDVDILIKTYLHTEEDGKHDLVNLIA